MSPEKKVLLLLLSLIILMAACVFTHLPKFMNETSSDVVTQATTEKVVKSTNEDIPKEEAKVTSPIAIEKVVENTKEELPKEEVKVEEKIEEVVEPLITTDKRYTRADNEKNIEDLSIEAQKLQIKINEYIKENPVIFKRASYKLAKSSNKVINMVVESLKEFPSIKIEVAGHTDAIGAKNVNQSISQARAKSVKARLVYYGIDKNRIIARGYGEDIPMVKNSPNGYSKINRRVEFNIIEE